tara:strand:- start:149 stop:700 length:552 start_codon:yes stop_codon:yes gene_type:complete
MLNLRNAGPIPGENFLSDKRNYPWHRPPELETVDATVEYVMGKMQEEETAELVFSMMELERPLTNIVTGLLLQGVATGKFQIDMALLAAGPVYRYIKMIADNENIKYEDGLKRQTMPITATTLKMAMGIIDDDPEEKPEADSAPEAPQEPLTGFMAAPTEEDKTAAPDKVQAAMLGMTEEEEA